MPVGKDHGFFCVSFVYVFVLGTRIVSLLLRCLPSVDGSAGDLV